ncbi:MAG TPA: ABC transporter substrate-binding protein [Thermoleophilia bacterium]|nr:ABC transporter substrate-binding protein [Thermoleophilia bacterium]
MRALLPEHVRPHLEVGLTQRGRSFSRLVFLVLTAALLVIGAASLAACSRSSGDEGTPAADRGTPKPGGTLHYPLPGDPVSIEPLDAQDSSGLQVAHQVFEGLTRWVMDDGVLATRPGIAESWESKDAQTWIFHLRKGVMFQAPVSRQVTAQDFVDSWTRVTDPANQSATAYILAPLEGLDDRGYQTDPSQGLTGVKALDDFTLQVTLRYPFADFPATLGHPVAAVTPVDYIDKVGDKAFARRPVGTGPYELRLWKRGKEIILARNAGYWDKEHAGYVDTIDLPIYDDVEKMWTDFQDGGLDCTQVPSSDVAAAQTSREVTSGTWTAGSWPAAAIYFVGVNMTDSALGGNLGLRKALAQAADPASVVDAVGPGVAAPAGGYVPPGIPGHRDGQDPYPFDMAAATSAVATLGSVPTLNYWYDVSDDNRRVADALVPGWKQAGLAVDPSDYEWGTYVDKLSRGNHGSGSQLFRVAWIADYPAMDAFLYPLFQSDQSRTGSYTFYSDKGVDDLLQKARATMDAQQRQNLYAQAEKLILTDMPAIPLYSYRYFRVVGPRAHGFQIDPMGLTDMSSIWLD